MTIGELHGKVTYVPIRYRQDSITTNIIDPITFIYPQTGIEMPVFERDFVKNKIKNKITFKQFPKKIRKEIIEYHNKIRFWADMSLHIAQMLDFGNKLLHQQ